MRRPVSSNNLLPTPRRYDSGFLAELRFHASLIKDLPSATSSSWDRLLTWTAIGLFVIGLLNPQIAKFVMEEWDGISRWWSLVPLGLLVLYALLKANYQRFVALQQSNDGLQRELERACVRPHLTGFFQNFQVYSYGNPTEERSGKAEIFVPGHERPLGLEAILHFRMVNDTPIPTTLHNFSLKVTYSNQEGFAEHADEFIRSDVPDEERGTVWEFNPFRLLNEEAAKRCPNLVKYLRTHKMIQGKALEGALVFRFPGLMYDFNVDPKVGTIELHLKLGIEDAWGDVHFIEDTWGPKPPPPPRILGSRRFI